MKTIKGKNTTPAGYPEYLPCKKCGSDNILHDGNSVDLHFINCLDCDYCTSTYENPYAALKEWNKRDKPEASAINNHVNKEVK